LGDTGHGPSVSPLPTEPDHDACARANVARAPWGPKERPQRRAQRKGPKESNQRKGTIFIDGPSMIIIDGPSMNINGGCPSMNIDDGCPSMDFQFFEIQVFEKTMQNYEKH